MSQSAHRLGANPAVGGVRAPPTAAVPAGGGGGASRVEEPQGEVLEILAVEAGSEAGGGEGEGAAAGARRFQVRYRHETRRQAERTPHWVAEAMLRAETVGAYEASLGVLPKKAAEAERARPAEEWHAAPRESCEGDEALARALSSQRSGRAAAVAAR